MGLQIISRTHTQVRFSDVDSYSVVHNSKYFDYFDLGRFHIVDSFFRRESPHERSEHLYLVLKATIKYIRYARFGDSLTIETHWLYDPSVRNASINLEHFVLRKGDNKAIVEGTSMIGICNEDYQLLYALPKSIKDYNTQQIQFFRERTRRKN